MNTQETKEEILDALEGKKKVELGKCPYCNSGNYVRDSPELYDDFIRVDCSCQDCNKYFIEYYGLDEVYSEDEEVFYSKPQLSEEEQKIVLRAIDLLNKKENNKKDYSKIINKIKGKLIREN